MPIDASTSRKLGGAAALLMATVLASRLLGFLRESVVAALFGASGASDAFYAAFTIPDMLNYLVAGGTLSITFIPIYSRHLASSSEEEGNRAFSIIATVMALGLGLAIVALEFATPFLVRRYLNKLDEANLLLAIRLTRILLPAQFFFYLGALASATLFARQRFWAAATAPLLYNLGTILGALLLGRRLGIDSLAWGTLGGAVIVPCLIQLVAALRAGVRYTPSLAIGNPDCKAWFVRSLPLMIGVSLVTADEWIIKYFAAGDPGAISCLSYARKLVLLPIAVAGQAIGQASMPFFSRLFAEGKKQELVELLLKSARASAAIAALCAAGLIALAIPTVELCFHRGHFSSSDVVRTAQFLRLFAVAIPFWGVQAILARGFYAKGDTLTPMVAGTAVTLLSLPIYWLLAREYGAVGLCLASDIGILCHCGALILLWPRDLAARFVSLYEGLCRSALTGLGAGVCAFAAVRFVPPVFQNPWQQMTRLAVGGLVFTAVALGLSRPLGATDIVLFAKRLSAKFSRSL